VQRLRKKNFTADRRNDAKSYSDNIVPKSSLRNAIHFEGVDITFVSGKMHVMMSRLSSHVIVRPCEKGHSTETESVQIKQK